MLSKLVICWGVEQQMFNMYKILKKNTVLKEIETKKRPNSQFLKPSQTAMVVSRSKR